MEISLRISPSAVEFARKMLDDTSEEMALMIYGFVAGVSPTVLTGDDWQSRPIQDFVKAGDKLIRSIPANAMVKYSIGMKEIDRMSQEDIHVIGGIKCYIPKYLLSIIGAREIVLENGALRLEPELEHEFEQGSK